MNRPVLFVVFYLIAAILIYVLSESGLIDVLVPGTLNKEVNALNIKGYGVLMYYSGIADALLHIAYGVKICRVTNVYETIEYVKLYRELGLSNIDSFYIIIDGKHARGAIIIDEICNTTKGIIVYHNGTRKCTEYERINTKVLAIDLTDRTYVFNPKDVTIMKCNIVFEIDDLYPDCDIIYYKGEYAFGFKDEVDKILEHATKSLS